MKVNLRLANVPWEQCAELLLVARDYQRHKIQMTLQQINTVAKPVDYQTVLEGIATRWIQPYLPRKQNQWFDDHKNLTSRLRIVQELLTEVTGQDQRVQLQMMT